MAPEDFHAYPEGIDEPLALASAKRAGMSTCCSVKKEEERQ
jgi:hypothetical protein